MVKEMEGKAFDIGHFLSDVYDKRQEDYSEQNEENFLKMCDDMKIAMEALEENDKNEEMILKRQRNALLGKEKEVKYYEAKLLGLIKEKGKEKQWYPPWYQSIEDAVFQEILGFSGMSEWIKGDRVELKDSSSAKIIGDRIYFLIHGKMMLQKQKLSAKRRRQLRAALLLPDPKKRSSDSQHEVYLLDGTRVKIYNDEGLAKKHQDCFIFRKFFVKEYTLEKQSDMHTISGEAIEMFKAMIKIGYNVLFVGATGTAKTTFLTTWQSYEDQSLEGIMIETDPEIPLDQIMPNAPIMQLVPTEDHFKSVIKDTLRSDPDYIIMAEARDAAALSTAVEAANKGTRRVKMTYHTTDVVDICYDIANRMVTAYGGDLTCSIVNVAKSFHYVFQFIRLKDKSKKRLKAIWEIRYDPFRMNISMHQICKYYFDTDSWNWCCDIGKDKQEIGLEENPQALKLFQEELRKLEQRYPMEEEHIYQPSYRHLF